MTIDSEALRIAMRGWASGVTIVTARSGDDAHGMTVSSFTSVSLKPPLVLICAERTTRTHRLIESSGAYAVSVLGQHQSELADRFGGRDVDHQNRFEGIETFTAVTGAPILAEHVSYFDCQVYQAHPAGTHTVFVGQVMAAELAGDHTPLVYWRRDFFDLGQLADLP